MQLAVEGGGCDGADIGSAGEAKARLTDRRVRAGGGARCAGRPRDSNARSHMSARASARGQVNAGRCTSAHWSLRKPEPGSQDGISEERIQSTGRFSVYSVERCKGFYSTASHGPRSRIE